MKKFGVMTLLLGGSAAVFLITLQSREALRHESAENVQQLPSRNEARVAELSIDPFVAEEGSRSSARFPNVQLVDQSGRKVRFYDDVVRNRSVCINFFYTQCNGNCPGTTSTIKKLRRDLAAQFDNDALVFISISLDPKMTSPTRWSVTEKRIASRTRTICRTGTLLLATKRNWNSSEDRWDSLSWMQLAMPTRLSMRRP